MPTSNRHTLPSRSPRYAFVMKRESGGPVATGSPWRAFLSSLHPFGEVVAQLSIVSAFPSLPTSIESVTAPVLTSSR